MGNREKAQSAIAVLCLRPKNFWICTWREQEHWTRNSHECRCNCARSATPGQTPAGPTHLTRVILFRCMLGAKIRLRQLLAGMLLSFGLVLSSQAQTTPTQSPSQTPKTSPKVEQVLPSYEGQNVSSLELAGRPDLDQQQLLPLLQQRVGEPFSQAKVDASVAALQRTGEVHQRSTRGATRSEWGKGLVRLATSCVLRGV